MNEAQEFYQESLKAYRERYEKQHEILSNVLTDLEKANYVVSGFILEVCNYQTSLGQCSNYPDRDTQ